MDQFDFVVVNEMFDESVLLLHMQLRIRVIDMLYIQSKNFSNPELDMSPELETQLLQLNQRDLAISRYATARLQATIKELEPTFSVMLGRFRALKELAAETCKRFKSNKLGNGDEKLSTRLKLERQRCLESVCEANEFCSSGSFADPLSSSDDDSLDRTEL